MDNDMQRENDNRRSVMKMGTVEKNRFSELLEELLNTAEIKNANLAKSLQYDVSYISKWISGRMLPAEKTKRKVLQGISHEIVKQGSKEGCEILSSNYQVVSEEELEAVSMIILRQNMIMYRSCSGHTVCPSNRRHTFLQV